jgi:hypothetical protein
LGSVYRLGLSELSHRSDLDPGDEIAKQDGRLGKQTLCQLSYSRSGVARGVLGAEFISRIGPNSAIGISGGDRRRPPRGAPQRPPLGAI